MYFFKQKRRTHKSFQYKNVPVRRNSVSNEANNFVILKLLIKPKKPNFCKANFHRSIFYDPCDPCDSFTVLKKRMSRKKNSSYLETVLEFYGETLELITVVEYFGDIKLGHIDHGIGLTKRSLAILIF